MLTINDKTVLTDFENAEHHKPSPQKIINADRTIYTSRELCVPKAGL
jgi:hypothetical protein